MQSERVLQQGMMTRAEIDTRAPFKSVKEAVTLFGEKVLAGELYNNNNTKFKEMQNEEEYENGHGISELEETKQSLEKAKQESEAMADCLTSLKQELEVTKQELQRLRFERELAAKPHHHHHHRIITAEPSEQIEDVKFVEESSRRFEAGGSVEFQKKRYVTFANPPCLAQVMIPNNPQGVEKLERLPSLKNNNNIKKKKPLIPLLASIFSRKKPSPGFA